MWSIPTTCRVSRPRTGKTKKGFFPARHKLKGVYCHFIGVGVNGIRVHDVNDGQSENGQLSLENLSNVVIGNETKKLPVFVHDRYWAPQSLLEIS